MNITIRFGFDYSIVMGRDFVEWKNFYSSIPDTKADVLSSL